MTTNNVLLFPNLRSLPKRIEGALEEYEARYGMTLEEAKECDFLCEKLYSDEASPEADGLQEQINRLFARGKERVCQKWGITVEQLEAAEGSIFCTCT